MSFKEIKAIFSVKVCVGLLFYPDNSGVNFTV